MNRSRTRIVVVVLALATAASKALAVTVVVTSTADLVTGCATTGTTQPGTDGCTLRDAILFSDANPPTPPAQNLIAFDIPGSGAPLIHAASTLPPITAATLVDGYTQPGASPNTQAVGSDAVIEVTVRGNRTVWRLLVVSGGAGSVIRGLSLSILDDGVEDLLPQIAVSLESCCNAVTGNFIGFDQSAGEPAYGAVEVDSSHNVIGGASPADRNVLGPGGDLAIVELLGSANLVQGNYIGIDAAGTGGLFAAKNGVRIDADSNQVIGNVISDNDGGIRVRSNGNAISGNRIGTDATGTALLANRFFGVVIEGSGNVVGSANSTNPILGALFDGNEIANTIIGAGIYVQSGMSNALLSNSLFSNFDLGIDLNNDFVTSNDPGDGDAGPNGLQNFPVLTSASGPGPQTNVVGSLNSAANTTYRIQLFSNSACDSTGYGEGETLVDELFVTTNAKGNAAIHDQVFPRIPPGQFVTATATDPAGNTSEFSQCVLVTAIGPPPPPPFRTITRFLEEGPIRVAPGVPVEFPVGVGARQEAREAVSGSVSIIDPAGNACQANLIRTGVGACALTFPSVGTYSVRAHYAGGAEFLGSDSDPLVVNVVAGAD
jgi:CSLREA domain-containing protein